MAAAQTNTVSNLAFGPVVERTINRASTGTNFLLNFRTGELSAPPPESASSGLDIGRWSQQEGFDAGVGVLRDNDLLTGFYVAAVPAPARCWDELTPAQAAARLEVEPPSSAAIMLRAYGYEATPETCVFKTREGGIGIAQLARIMANPPGLKIRYKFVDKAPADSQTQSNATAAGSWSPPLLPGEKPDLFKIMEEAKQLASTGHYEEALQRYRWHFNHAPEYGDNWQNAVRVTSELTEWAELGRRYPKAKQALIEIRDNKTREIVEGRGYPEMFGDVEAINRNLQDEDATYALFKTIRESDPRLVEQCYHYLHDLLLAKGEYQWCLHHLGDPQACFDSMRQSFETERARYSVPANPPPQTPRAPNGAPLPPPVPAPRPDEAARMKKWAEDRFVGDTGRLIETLVGVGRKAEAEKIRNQAVAVLDDARLKSAVADAEARVRKNLHQ